jgi:hypothetical protein
MPKESPDMMRHYIVDVVHGGRLSTSNLVDGPSITITRAHYLLLAGLYVLGETLMDAKFQNKIIHEFLRLSKLKQGPYERRYYPNGECVNIIYQGTATDSPARRMLIDFATGEGNVAWLSFPNLDREYLLDGFKALLRKTDAQEEARDFRGVPMNAEDYVVLEYPPPQDIPGVWS